MEFPFTSELFKPEKGEAFFDTKREGFAGWGRGFNRGRGGAIPPHSDGVRRGPPLMYNVNPGNWVLKENDLEGAKFIWKNFESRKSDVWIVTPPKVIFQLISKFNMLTLKYFLSDAWWLSFSKNSVKSTKCLETTKLISHKKKQTKKKSFQSRPKCVKTRNSHGVFFREINSLVHKLFSKNVTFTKFLPKKCER